MGYVPLVTCIQLYVPCRVVAVHPAGGKVVTSNDSLTNVCPKVVLQINIVATKKKIFFIKVDL